MRLRSNADRIQKMAAFPYLFCQIRQPHTNYLVIPRHSSENRPYIPLGFAHPDVIAGDACTILPNASLYSFGIMMSKVHYAWMKVVCGRIKSDFRYSPAIYNNFPWLDISEDQRQKIEETAQGILDARNKYSDRSLADMYDDLIMPPELLKAHQQNDIAVMKAYGFTKVGADGKNHWLTESEVVAELMKMYQELC